MTVDLIDVRDLAAEMSATFKAMCDALGISYDRFIRTTDADHYRASKAIWKAMEAAGDLYLSRYEGWYSVRDEAFYDEKELVEGEGGAKLSPQGTPVTWTAEETWFFRLSKYQQPLLDLYRDNPDFIRPEARRNEIVRFVEGGLSDLSVSRTTFDWGVPVPGSPGHVMYVWVDALTNYLTGAGYPDALSPHWPADLHLIGKDIVRFHAVYWPAFLLSAGIALPKTVFGHGFVLHRGEKMSKSVGNVVDPLDLAGHFGVDALRYFLLREVSFGQDGSYSAEAIVTRVNAELANAFGGRAGVASAPIGGIAPWSARIRTERPTNILTLTGAVLAIFLVWAALFSVDKVTRGPGRVLPSVQNQVVQHLEGGIVKRILVEEGQRVKKGQILLQLSNEFTAADAQNAQTDVVAKKIALARMDAAVA